MAETETLQEARRRVALGAALLDEKAPGWRERIDLKRFWIAESCDCIVGQTFGRQASGTGDPFEYGLVELGLGEAIDEQDSSDCEYGFNAGSGTTNDLYVSYGALQAAWVDLLDPDAS